MQKRMKKLTRGMALWLVMVLVFSCFAVPESVAAGYTYKNGVRTGSATGYGGPLMLEVTVDGGKITGIVVGANNETPDKLASAKAVIGAILTAQNPDVDTVSGATQSSKAIISAVEKALQDAYESIFDSGYGTKKFPFVIDDEDQLADFRDSVNDGEAYAGQYITLNSDIDISEDDWIPIDGFAGNFDGKGHEITGLTIGSSETAANRANAGLFGSLTATAVVKNLGLTEVAIYASSGVSTYAGGLAARTAGGTATGGTVIDNCYVEGEMIYSETTAGTISFAGGLVASLGAYTSVSNCWTDISVEGKAGGTMSAYAGGLTSLTGNNIVVTNCYTLGDVSATSRNKSNGVIAGGLFGMQSGKSYNCYSLSEVTADNIDADDAYQKTTYSPVGVLAGQVTGSGMMHTMYYSADAVLTVNGAVYDPVAAGRGANNTDPENVSVLDAAYMVSARLVTELNKGLKSAEQYITLPQGVPLYTWELSGHKVTLSDEIYVNDEIDGSIFAGGEGTAEDPFVIETEEQLRAFAGSLNEAINYAGRYLRLAKDVDVSGADWNPVGQGEYAFCGTFDGGGYEIQGLRYGSAEAAKDATDDVYVALFGVIGQNGLVKNLGLTDVGLYTTGEYSVNTAAIAGYLENGGIDNCYATGRITGKTTVRGNNFVGGLVGNQYKGYIINSWADVDVRSEAVGQYLSEAGGLVSLNNRGLIANCYTLGNASGDAVRAAEGMAYVSNLVACQAGTMVNCYVLGDAVSDSYSRFLGAISGMTTGIGKGYLSYYNKEATQKIDGIVPDPFVAVGTTVSMTEDGVVSSGFNYRLAGYTLAEMKSSDFAAVLNGNFAAFPVDLSQWLPAGATLKTWAYDGTEELVVLTDTDAEINYVPVIIEEEEDSAYKAGTYYGRAYGDNEIIVRVTVSEEEITAIDVTSHNEGQDFDPAAVITAILAAQSTSIDYDTTDNSLAALVNAIDTALEKAVLGDTTGYGKVNSAIFARGTGKEADPYRIATAQQLVAFAASINTDENYQDAYVVLTADISLKGIDWLPSGSNQAYPFSGTFDGGGHTISDMTVGSESDPADYQYVGLFGYANNATIRNVNLTNVSIHNYYTGDGRAYTGVIAGAVEVSTYIDSCSTQGALTVRADKQCYAGGLVSFTSGTDGAESYVSNCRTDVDITSVSDTSWVYAGGISGLVNRSYIVNCYTFGDVTGDSTVNVNRAAVGGIAGFQAGYVRNCYAMGDMKTVLSSTDVGGYAGRHTGIATTYYAYYNTDAAHYSGNTLLNPTPDVGVYVPASGTGLVTAEKVEGRTSVDMKSGEFAALLNQNLTDTQVAGVMPDGIDLKSWIYDRTLDLVVLEEDSDDSNDSGGKKSGGKKSGGTISDDTAAGDSPSDDTTSGGTAQDKISAVTDIANHWARDAIQWVYAQGLFSGTSDTTFSPNASMTRAMLVTVLYRLAGEPESGENYFTDVEDGKWYTDAVAWAAGSGIIQGVGEGLFATEGKISREQLAVMLYRYAESKGLTTAASGDLSRFRDNDKVSDWAEDAMKWAVSAGIMSGRDNGVLDPGGEATRAEAAAILKNFVAILTAHVQ